jgi:hypothetical protein
MNFAQWKHLYHVLPEIDTIIDQIRKISGKEIDFQIQESISADSLVIIAREHMPCHILRMKPSQLPYRNEAIAHECGHVIRVLSASPERRLVSRSTTSNIQKATGELDQQKSNLPPDQKIQMYDTWINGLIQEVNNLPVDVRIEQWIFDTYPSLRSEQSEFLRNQARSCVQTFSKALEANTPPKVFLCNMGMVYAYLTKIGFLIGEDFEKYFGTYPEIIALGKDLLTFLETPDMGYLQDIETTNQWAKKLELTDWFSWTNFENIPQSYGI